MEKIRKDKKEFLEKVVKEWDEKAKERQGSLMTY